MINPIKMIGGYSILMVAIIGTQVGFYAFSPSSFWFKYSSVKVIGYVAPGEPISAISEVERYRKTHMAYNDVLRCDLDGSGFQYYSQYKSDWLSGGPSEGVIVSRWKYHGAVPETGKCYIRSATSAMGIFGVLSQPDIQESNVFTIGEIK